MNIKGIIFDADGTLIDSMYYWYVCGEKYITGQGIDVEKDLLNIRAEILGLNLYECCVYFQKKFLPHKTADEIIKEIGVMTTEFYENEVLLKPGVREFLDKMRRANVPMCIATLAERSYIEKALVRLGVIDYFTEIFTCSENDTTKTEPDIFRLALAKLGTQKSETWIFEDSLYAAKTAKADDFKVCGIFDASEPSQAELKELCDVYIESFEELN